MCNGINFYCTWCFVTFFFEGRGNPNMRIRILKSIFKNYGNVFDIVFWAMYSKYKLQKLIISYLAELYVIWQDSNLIILFQWLVWIIGGSHSYYSPDADIATPGENILCIDKKAKWFTNQEYLMIHQMLLLVVNILY